MSGQTYFITGGNRGIGFELVHQLAKADAKNVVIATTRSPTRAKELYELSKTLTNIHVIELDVSNEKSIATIDAQLEKLGITGIDTFISNAGIANSLEPTLKTKGDLYLEHYKVNALGPVLVFQQVYKYLLAKDTRKVIFISTIAASLGNPYPFATTAYGQSKAALNFSVIQLATELKSDNFIVVPIHPGGVATDMAELAIVEIKKTNPEFYNRIKSNLISPQQSASDLIGLIEGFEQKDSGVFYDHKGEVLTY